jgi:hypothetical protein
MFVNFLFSYIATQFTGMSASPQDSQTMWQYVVDGDIGAVAAVMRWIADGHGVNAALPELFDYSLCGGSMFQAPPLAALFSGLEHGGLERHAADVSEFTNDRVEALKVLLQHGADTSIMVTTKSRCRKEQVTMNIVLFACQRLPCDTLNALLAMLLPAVPRELLGVCPVTYASGSCTGYDDQPMTAMGFYCGEKEFGVYIPRGIYGWDCAPGIRLLLRYGADVEFALKDKYCCLASARAALLEILSEEPTADADMQSVTGALHALSVL